MQKIIILCALAFLGVSTPLTAQQPGDSLAAVVYGLRSRLKNQRTASSRISVDEHFLDTHFSGNFVQALQSVPGVQSMDIGSGFSKPMIRGLGFNRIAVAEGGVKQEGQQWGADHGLEIDAFGVSGADVVKGPSSLLYGSDAMGGVIELQTPRFRPVEGWFGEVALLGKTVNDGLGLSTLVGLRRGRWQVQLRLSGQSFADYRVPTDTVVYLTEPMPLRHRRLKNTAGSERDASLFAHYKKDNYHATLLVSNAWQKTGFFPGAHGVPDLSRLAGDGHSRNVELPYSRVDHLKVQTRHEFTLSRAVLSADLAWQYNDREEWSAFHTHYGTQQPPAHDPDKELAFRLHTLSGGVALRLHPQERYEQTVGFNVQGQFNRIGGYSFLLPRYDRQAVGAFYLGTYKASKSLTLTGGVRYDYGGVQIAAHDDAALALYLMQHGYDAGSVEQLRQVSPRLRRTFDDLSGAIGVVWTVSETQLIKANIGRSFRLPGVNELGANGVHHGTFRHEQGDHNLSSEHGWTLDASYELAQERFALALSPFVSLFDHYLYLRPTSEWSVLPHAGQIYRYTSAEALFAGTELSLHYDVIPALRLSLTGEYVYTENRDAHTALTFSPPAQATLGIAWRQREWELSAELQGIARQTRVAHNEDTTPGTALLHLGGKVCFHALGRSVHVYAALRNVFNRRYYNHLSFYRKIMMPEPGRNLNLHVNIPLFNS